MTQQSAGQLLRPRRFGRPGISDALGAAPLCRWHTHPLGQPLIVTFGRGLHQLWGGPVEEIGPGDVVTVGPNEKHWHGASPMTAMTHIAIQESLDGKPVEWLEKVTDEQYQRRA